MRMTIASYNTLKHFSQTEFPDPLMMDQDLMFKLDAMRDTVGLPFIIHASYATEGHSPDSTHYQGLAIDGHFEGLSAVDQYLISEEWNWNGLGFYVAWNFPGIHVDVRILAPYEKAARWWRDENGIYHAVTPEDIRRFI